MLLLVIVVDLQSMLASKFMGYTYSKRVLVYALAIKAESYTLLVYLRDAIVNAGEDLAAFVADVDKLTLKQK